MAAPDRNLLLVVQRKVLTPNDCSDLGDTERRLLAFERLYEEAARPFEWKFTRNDLARLMQRLRKQEGPTGCRLVRYRTFELGD